MNHFMQEWWIEGRASDALILPYSNSLATIKLGITIKASPNTNAAAIEFPVIIPVPVANAKGIMIIISSGNILPTSFLCRGD